MPFLNFFRNLFGQNREEPRSDGFDDYQQHRDTFRNPIWQNDEDDDEDDDFRRPRISTHYSIFSNPLEITRYFESQMDSMLKNFFFGFGDNRFSTFSEFTKHYDRTMEALPFKQTPKERNLRANMLKPGYDIPSEREKLDVDIDGKVSADELTEIWDNQNTNKMIQPFSSYRQTLGNSVTKHIIKKSNGILEHQEVIRDNEGNEQTIISRQIGGKKHTVITKRDKTGVKTVTEDFVNMDENELKDFNEKWATSAESNTNNHRANFDFFFWEKFFGPNPKL